MDYRSLIRSQYMTQDKDKLVMDTERTAHDINLTGGGVMFLPDDVNTLETKNGTFLDTLSFVRSNLKREVEILGRNSPKITYADKDLNPGFPILTVAQGKKFDAIMESIKAKDPGTYGHCIRVGESAKQLCDFLKKGDRFAEQMLLAGYVHDAGKIMISDSILNSPTRLTDEQYEEIKRHTVNGEKLLSGMPKYMQEAARMHHDSFYPDRNGYPDPNIHRYGIPEPARIIAVCDVFDALAHTRSYKQGFSLEHSYNELLPERRLDPDLTVAFIQMQFEQERNNTSTIGKDIENLVDKYKEWTIDATGAELYARLREDNLFSLIAQTDPDLNRTVISSWEIIENEELSMDVIDDPDTYESR
jgi:HD-GYP domain-containing protein (c-di-GMP phosphodiesterase class II)